MHRLCVTLWVRHLTFAPISYLYLQHWRKQETEFIGLPVGFFFWEYTFPICVNASLCDMVQSNA